MRKNILKLAVLALALAGGGAWWETSSTAPEKPAVAVAARPAQETAPKPTVAVAPKPTVAVAPKPASVVREGEYTDKEHLRDYIAAFGTLPKNFITKREAQRLGWTGGPLEPYAPGKSIGGDFYGNYERTLPQGRYRECDVDTRGRPRGAKRIIYSDDRRIYYTDDHYGTFKRLK